MLINELLTLTPKIFLILRLGIKAPTAHWPIPRLTQLLAYSTVRLMLSLFLNNKVILLFEVGVPESSFRCHSSSEHGLLHSNCTLKLFHAGICE